jgi:YaiO family outer membrane protein
MRPALLALSLAAALPAWAQPTQVEAGYAYDHLSGAAPDWRAAYVYAERELGARRGVHGALRAAERFNLRDREAAVGTYLPLAPALTAAIEASYSPTAHVLARRSAFAQLHAIVADGWLVGAAVRHSAYALADSNVGSLGVERYGRGWRAAYTAFAARTEASGTGVAHRVQFDRYYGERSHVGAVFVAGREVEYLGPAAGAVSTPVRSVALLGRHALTAEWALSWEVLRHTQGEFYRRHGVRAGLRYGF